jgi:hypothetical protein
MVSSRGLGDVYKRQQQHLKHGLAQRNLQKIIKEFKQLLVCIHR